MHIPVSTLNPGKKWRETELKAMENGVQLIITTTNKWQDSKVNVITEVIDVKHDVQHKV